MDQGDRFTIHPAEEAVGVETGLSREDERGAAHEREEHVAEDHVEREARDLRDAIAGADAEGVPLPAEEVAEPLVAAEHRLGRAGAPGGEEHVGRALGIEVRERRAARAVHGARAPGRHGDHVETGEHALLVEAGLADACFAQPGVAHPEARASRRAFSTMRRRRSAGSAGSRVSSPAPREQGAEHGGVEAEALRAGDRHPPRPRPRRPRRQRAARASARAAASSSP